MLEARTSWRIFAVVGLALGLLCGPAHARGSKPTPKLIVEQPAEGGFVGAKFKVKGRVTPAPPGTIVRMGDQKATVGSEGVFELNGVSTREGKQALRITCYVAARSLSETRNVVADLTAPMFTDVEPAEEAVEFDTAEIVVSGRLVDVAPLTLRVNGEPAKLEADGRFQLRFKLSRGDKLSIYLDAIDAGGNSSRIERRLRRRADPHAPRPDGEPGHQDPDRDGPPAEGPGTSGPIVRCQGQSVIWTGRDGRRILLPFNPKAGAAAILAHEAAGGPLTKDGRPLVVRLGASAARSSAFWPMIDTLVALGMPVALLPAAPDERRRRWPIDTMRIERTPADAGGAEGWSLQRTTSKGARRWLLSDVNVAAFSAPGESPEGRQLAATLDELTTDRIKHRIVPTIRFVSAKAVDVRLLRALGKPPFRIDDVIFVDSDRWVGDRTSSAGLIGIGGGGAPPPDPKVRQRVATAIDRSVSWLIAHQRPDGAWGAADWQQWCDFERNPAGAGLDGSGKEAVFDIGVTGLAMLALLDMDRLTPGEPSIVQAITNGVKYLIRKQDTEGRFGSKSPEQSAYNHAIASQAVIRAFDASGSPTWRDSAQRALKVIESLQVPGSGWGYGAGTGTCDTSLTGWMGMALISAVDVSSDDRGAGLKESLALARESEDGMIAWFDEVTDPLTGRVGYSKRGSGSDRVPDRLAAFPVAQSEAMTAVGLLARVAWIRKSPETPALVRKGTALCAARPPAWDPKSGSIDMCYWYFGTHAMAEIDGAERRAWDAALSRAIVGSQRSDGNVCTYLGSWDPIDPWGPDGGRVYSTALMTMCLAHWYDHEGLVRPWNR